MGTYLLAWNPKTTPFTAFEQLSKQLAGGKRADARWSTGNNKSIRKSERFFFLRQYRNRGIVAAGYTTSNAFTDEHWQDRSRTANYVLIRFDTMIPVDCCLSVPSLSKADLGINFDRIQASGIGISPEAASRLESLWQTHLLDLGKMVEPISDEVIGADKFIEGAVCRIAVNAYERNSKARRACIKKFGTDCSVCGFNFGKFYGELGDGYIHVHHLRELASIGKKYEVDPATDLRPVCPNCHSMLHRQQPALSIEELRIRIER